MSSTIEKNSSLTDIILNDKYRLRSKLPRKEEEMYLNLVIIDEKTGEHYFTNGAKAKRNLYDVETGEATGIINIYSINDILSLKNEYSVSLSDYEIEPVNENK